MLAVTLIAIVMVVIVVVLALLRAKHRDGQPSHQAGAYEIGGDRIIGQHDPPEIARRAMHWPVALHANDPVGNGEARRNGGVDIEMLRSMPFQRRSELSCSTSAPTATPGQR